MLLNDFFVKIGLFLFSFLVPIEVWAAMPSKPVEIQLEREVRVSGDAVVLGDVATIYAKNIHHFQMLSGLVISNFNGDGSEIRIPQAYLESRVREVLPAGTDFAIHGPQLLSFRKENSKLNPFSIFAAEWEKKARKEGKIPAWVEVAMEPGIGFEQIAPFKFSDLKIEPAAILNQWKGDLTFRITPPGAKDFSWVKLRVKWFAEVWQAKRNIGILSQVSPEDFSKARLEITDLREDPLLATEDISNAVGISRTRRSLPSGSALVVSALEKMPDAKFGQPLKVVFVSESGIRVSADGALMGAGSIGGEVKAKLRTSKKIVTGKLVSGGLMEVTL